MRPYVHPILGIVALIIPVPLYFILVLYSGVSSSLSLLPFLLELKSLSECWSIPVVDRSEDTLKLKYYTFSTRWIHFVLNVKVGERIAEFYVSLYGVYVATGDPAIAVTLTFVHKMVNLDHSLLLTTIKISLLRWFRVKFNDTRLSFFSPCTSACVVASLLWTDRHPTHRHCQADLPRTRWISSELCHACKMLP